VRDGGRERRVGLVRRLAGEALEQHDPERVDVGAGVERLQADRFGREVVRGAHEDVRTEGGRRAGRGSRQPEVGDPDRAVTAEQHVLRLDVAVDEVGLVRGSEPRRRRAEHRQCLARAEPATRAEHLTQRRAVDELQHQIGAVGRLAPVVHRHDVRVAERRGSLRLATEPVPEGRVGAEVGVGDLDGDQPVEHLVVGAVDDGHAAPSDLVEQPVPTTDVHAGPHPAWVGRVAGAGVGNSSSARVRGTPRGRGQAAPHRAPVPCASTQAAVFDRTAAARRAELPR
jgi:hypothetical protein